ncbi:MAG: ABC transporter permease [Bacteroidetes Order II. Incertae sedis bacterium]|jgi:peptide/nickel transport system permease protein|nr:ABC transporter permease [Bacteroidetes Order II. bacterium]HAY36102.1 ABC transporter permease [Bacteroidota bacterium]MBT4052483.1 ABC transporter permease [Bacteroidetes Order II. bacterium]MBT4601924.1 ABC transporter permease [Bacteroidetes Order II. bacterium]MBT5249068.1 ABC transporter permease [Bacteroidetes Order II. bacterium]
MLRYVAKRLMMAVFILWAVATIAFALTFLSGDPATLMIGDHWTAEQIDSFREQMGYDRPLLVQYGDYLAGIPRGDFGISVRQQVPVIDLIVQRFPATLELTAAALFLILFISIPLGVLSAVKRNTPADRVAMSGALFAQSVPTFWLGIMLILVFGVWLRWLPVSGRGSFAHLMLPAITLATFSTARIARLVRSSMLDVLGQDYIRTARAKGLPEWRINYVHALRNALIPVITMLGIEIGSLLGGALITETVFAWPGIGRLTLQAIQARDLPLVQGVITFGALVFVMVNLIVDLSYSFIDPRIRNE